MAVVITGIGVYSPLGVSYSECIETMQRGTPCVGDIENFDTTGFPMKAAGEVRSQGQVLRTPPNVDRKVFFLDKALIDIQEESRINNRFTPTERIMNIGCGVDYFDITTLQHHRSGEQIKELARKHRIEGGCNIFTAACVASTQAIGASYRMLKQHRYKVILTGGTESMISCHSYTSFHLLGVMATGHKASEACKPFDKARNGTVLGEGAIVMALENTETALPGSILAEIVGYGSSMDAYAVTAPDPSAEMLAYAIQKALDDAGIGPKMIDCAHLHGTGTPRNAVAEYKALYRIFGDRVSELPVYSMKGQIGHLIGACGAMEMLGVIYSLQNQKILPTINFAQSDPEAPLFVIKGEPLSMPIRYVLKLNSAFGGQNTALIIKKYE